MRITQWGEYGVHCCCYLAKCHHKGVATIGAAEIAQSQGIDIQYTQQILQRLRRNSLITSVRGPQGGYKLSKSPEQISLLEVLRATEGDSFEIICETKPLNLERCNASALCTLRPIWYQLKVHIDTFLENYSIADLTETEDLLNSPVQIGSN